MIYYCKAYRDEDCYSVEFPDITGTSTYGKTLEEALAMAKDALNLMLAAMVDDGEPLPKSKSRKAAGYYPVEVKPSILAAAEIRQARKAAGLTQKEMANRLNVAYQVYQKLEDPDRSNPTIKTLTQVARCLGHDLKLAI
ncbi:MAG: type II toxin-antitoxin system HicB family antitoxin [Candidatus Obscuribacterales bacterium]|nr:type II toxin-antitoxin system HicB family antitoxin [Candidatus Obscuribacterales bacterium]